MVRPARIVIAFLLLFFSGLAFCGPVNINAADAATLAEELKGVGAVKAQAIVEYRKQNGPFESINDLQYVKGIGEATVAKNQENMILGTGKK
ncbi:hypothetical protein MNBD_GAMMA26-1991 [hydrothermal vent metagenome]|uniref:Competence protein ComEA n=1 Tax=hydrothermal vent metagenome TaxID=652676 RepID=A0A3B1AYT2_9ZZZZ